MTYPIAEIFSSVQGEGRWTGMRMLFVRLAGCNVGRYTTEQQVNDLPIFHTSSEDLKLVKESKHSICTTFDGQRFLCDTDYHPLLGKMSTGQILSHRKGELTVCLTGGEPFLHDLKPLIDQSENMDGLFALHIETSGTLPIRHRNLDWITCCPKDAGSGLWGGIYDFANEWKILVGPHFDQKAFESLLHDGMEECEEIYFQPINGVEKVWRENVEKCLALQEIYPYVKLSSQLHKYLEVR